MKKCIVLDLDDTLWGGVVGEDGFDGIKLSTKAPGAFFIAFQQVLLDLYDSGIILAINSHNNYDDAMEVIKKHPNMILKESHFAAIRINWKDKVENMKELAKELSIGLDSVVFLDDTPLQRELMLQFLPEVETPELPKDPAEYAKFLMSLDYFDSQVITNEDKMRGNLYVTERLRRESEKTYDNKQDFLKSLGLEFYLFKNEPSAFERLAQLTEKTNQFNTNKNPLSVSELEAYLHSGEYVVYHARVTDQFGDHGIVAFALVQKLEEEWEIKSFLLSCRVLDRGIEDAFIHALAQGARKENIQRLSILFMSTEKNAPARDFISRISKDTKTISVDTTAPEWVTIHHENI